MFFSPCLPQRFGCVTSEPLHHHRRRLLSLHRPPRSDPTHRNQSQKLKDIQPPPNIRRHTTQTPKEPTHKHQLHNHHHPQEDIEIPPHERPMQHHPLPVHPPHTAQQPRRAKEVNHRDDYPGDDAEVEGGGHNAENGIEGVETEDRTHAEAPAEYFSGGGVEG